ncbi:CU044_5270 family protein [Streptomyces sp. NBC_00178]|uniref:CU044_5270 family protein n=1 Tax=Streptomyces sp. NBC_00178 TaxID=2975672 RepID=UPI002E2BA39A|nr:CU044_5270 family protein [Streptomyces sp. NBC_00178]
MNADNSRAGFARSEAEELLAAPVDWDLSPSRHLHHKDVLMQQIDHDRNSVGETSPAPSRRRRLPRLALMVPATSLALAGALVVTLSGGDHASAPTAKSAVSSPARVTNASVTLGRIADAAMKTDATPVREDQFVYFRRLVRENKGTFGGPVVLGAAHKDERWLAQKPGPVTTTGWLRSSGKDAMMPGQLGPVTTTSPVRPGVWYPTYAWLASLPTDPDALLELLYTQTRVDERETKDEAVFGTVGDLLFNAIMPPATASALYQAAARIPGVTWIPDAVDAAGRHGIGITRRDARSATRTVLIFDKDTLAYTGSQSYFINHKSKADARGTTGDVLYGTDAVMERGVVDRHDEAPAKTAG